MALLPRLINSNNNICYDSFGNAYYCQTTWNTWGRWVALAAIIIAFLLFFYLCSCYSARRRRRLGQQPMYGTGWARTPFGHGQAQYNPGYTSQNPQPQQEVPPAYTQNHGGYYGQNQGYFGGQQTDVEMQPPQNTYRAGEAVYSPPDGPPPAKKGDGMIR